MIWKGYDQNRQFLGRSIGNLIKILKWLPNQQTMLSWLCSDQLSLLNPSVLIEESHKTANTDHCKFLFKYRFKQLSGNLRTLIYPSANYIILVNYSTRVKRDILKNSLLLSISVRDKIYIW